MRYLRLGSVLVPQDPSARSIFSWAIVTGELGDSCSITFMMKTGKLLVIDRGNEYGSIDPHAWTVLDS